LILISAKQARRFGASSDALFVGREQMERRLLDNMERSDLAMAVAEKGFPVVKKLLDFIVDDYREELDAATTDAEIVRIHALSKSAGIIRAALLKRIAIEVAQHQEAHPSTEKRADTGEGIDMDDIERLTEHMPNLLGDVHYAESGEEETK
jgi:hypothetical protein